MTKANALPNDREQTVELHYVPKSRELDKFNLEGQQLNEQNHGTVRILPNSIEEQSIEEIAFDRETPLERKERAHRRSHGNARLLCLTCAGLSESDAKEWNRLRTRGRCHNARGLSLGSYFPARISESDCVLASRSQSTLSATEISDWYECRDCYRTIESPGNKSLIQCPTCCGRVDSVAEPFQRTQFSPHMGNGAEAENHVGPCIERRRMKDIAVRHLYSDPNSGFQKGGTGYLRVPLDASRKTRADAPEWLPDRELFFQTLKPRRTARAERIFCGFYIHGQTDKQIAYAVSWSKDAIKKERYDLMRRGNEFFRSLAAKRPPCPAIDETQHHQRHLHGKLKTQRKGALRCKDSHLEVVVA
jgi:hypothetical protein